MFCLMIMFTQVHSHGQNRFEDANPHLYKENNLPKFAKIRASSLDHRLERAICI